MRLFRLTLFAFLTLILLGTIFSFQTDVHAAHNVVQAYPLTHQCSGYRHPPSDFTVRSGGYDGYTDLDNLTGKCSGLFSYTTTPTGDSVTYDFSDNVPGTASYLLQAFIPGSYATAYTAYEVNLCGKTVATLYINQYYHSGWTYGTTDPNQAGAANPTQTQFTIPGSYYKCSGFIKVYSPTTIFNYMAADAIFVDRVG